MSKPITAAGIDIGSNSIKMLIAEIERPGELRVLEDVKLHSPIGDDTFTNGRIGAEATANVCRSLKQMSQLMKDYGVQQYRACATSGVREASNRIYFLEHVKQAAAINVELIDRSVERYLTYQALHHGLPSILTYRDQGLLLVEIGSAGVQVSLYIEGKLRSSEHVRIGVLKIKEVLDSLRHESLQFTNILQQYIDSQIALLLEKYKNLSISHYLVLGGESALIANKWGDEIHGIRSLMKDCFDRRHRDILQSGVFKLAQQYQIGEERADQILPTSIIMSEFWKATQAEYVMLPEISLRHGLLHHIATERTDMRLHHDYIEDLTAFTLNIASNYHIDLNHSLKVKQLASKLYKACNRLFALDSVYGLCLQLAAILHDVGKYISLVDHEQNSYHILKSLDFLGLTDTQKDMIASMALYHPRGVQIPIKSGYSDEDNLILARLTSILKLANALDCSHRQLVKDVRVTLRNGDELHVKPTYEGSIELEEWAFEQESQLFEQINGYKIVLER